MKKIFGFNRPISFPKQKTTKKNTHTFSLYIYIYIYRERERERYDEILPYGSITEALRLKIP